MGEANGKVSEERFCESRKCCFRWRVESPSKNESCPADPARIRQIVSERAKTDIEGKQTRE